MKKNRWILLLVLLGAAFLVSCGKRNLQEKQEGELVYREAVEESLTAFFQWKTLTQGPWVGIIYIL